MYLDTKNWLKDASGGSYKTPDGYVNSGYWSTYADFFAKDGSDDQIIAAMTKSVPEAWLKSKGLSGDAARQFTLGSDEWKDFTSGADFSRNPSGESRDSDYYMGAYSKGLQTRLRNDFKNSKKGIENQGVANLRDQSQDALSQDLKGIDADANSRGLLFSGKREAARGAAAAARSNELGQVAGDFSRGLSDTERRLNSDVFSSEMDSAFKQADLNDIMSGSFYNKMQRNLGDVQGQAQAAIGLGDGLGSLSGALAGRFKNRKPTQPVRNTQSLFDSVGQA